MKNATYFLIILCLTACNKNEDKDRDYEVGKNYYTTVVNGDTREYWIHVPAIYNEDKETPVVFMLHGTSGDGEKFYNISGWKELAEEENLITIYPSSWRYCIIDEGITKNTTKWNIFPVSKWVYCAGQNPRDDIKFLSQVLDETKRRFNIDDQRVYLAGFSNGGAMAYRCAVEMGNVLAAIVESGGSYSQDTFYAPLRNVPITFQLGNEDAKWFGEGETYPMSKFDSLVSGSLGQRIVNSHALTFDLKTTYTRSGSEDIALIANFESHDPTDEHEFNFILVKGLAHNYPNGNNHPLKGAELNWEWMKQYKIE